MKLVVLDRDGVINVERVDFVKSPSEFVPIAGSLESIALLNKHNYRVAIFTNQSGVSRGLFTEQDLYDVHEHMRSLLQTVGGTIDHIWFCPHHPSVTDCNCRKPKPGMLYSIATHYGISLDGVPVIGDRETDMQAAEAVNAKPMLISSTPNSHYNTYQTLWDAVHIILKEETDAEKNISPPGNG